MGLVDYDSDSDQDEKPQEVPQEEKKPSLLSQFNLPAPKKSAGPRKILLEKEKELPEPTGSQQQSFSLPSSSPEMGTSTSSNKASGGLLSSLLPKPKNTKVDDDANKSEPQDKPHTNTIATDAHNTIAAPLSRKNRTLGGGIKGQFDGEVKLHEEYYAPESLQQKTATSELKKTVKIVPASVLARQAKYGENAPESRVEKVEAKPLGIASHSLARSGPKKKLPALFSFHEEKVDVPLSQQKSVEDHETVEQVVAPHTRNVAPNMEQVVHDEDSKQHVSQTPASIDVGQYESRKGKRKDINVVDFDVNEFYQSKNDEDLQIGVDNNPEKVHTIGSGRHQLSSLITSAQQNKEGLEQMFRENKRRKAEARQRFGLQ